MMEVKLNFPLEVKEGSEIQEELEQGQLCELYEIGDPARCESLRIPWAWSVWPSILVPEQPYLLPSGPLDHS